MLLIYGRNTVLQALSSQHKVTTVILETNIKNDSKISEIISLAEEKNIEIEYSPKNKLSALTKNNEHQGVVAYVNFQEIKLKDIDEENLAKSFIYISEATYEQNVGAIIRTAECLGFGGVVLPSDINITSTICKISTGAIFYIPIIRIPIFQAIKSFKDLGFFIYGIERNGESYFKTDLTTNNLYIIGGEDKSLTENVRSRCDKILEIPQFGETNSLNMSVAAGIVISEDIKQKLSNFQNI